MVALPLAKDKQPIAMELLEGATLKHLINGQPLRVERILTIGVQLADALDAAHCKGVIHPDITPANVLSLSLVRLRLNRPGHR